MVPANLERKSLYEEAKAAFNSLLQQTVAVFVGFAIMLLITGGTPSAMIVAIIFFLSTTCVALAEKTRLTPSKRVQASKGTSLINEANKVPSSNSSAHETIASDLPEKTDLREKFQNSDPQITSQDKSNWSENTTNRTIILRYTNNDFSLEVSPEALEDFLNIRVLICLRSATPIYVESRTASFLVPSNSPELARMFSEIKASKDSNIYISFLDAEYTEIILEGTWVTSSEDSNEGIFIGAFDHKILSFLHTIWNQSSGQFTLQKK